MQIPRFFLPADFIDMQSRVVTISDAAICNQLANVLRMRGGEQLDILDGRGSIYHCILNKTQGNRGRCTAAIDSQEQATGEPRIKLAVAMPLLRSGRFEWAIEKLTELGANEIVVIETKRSVVQVSEKSSSASGREQKLKRWHAIAREAAEQCERGLIPEVVWPVSLERFLEEGSSQYGRLLICAERSGAQPLSALLANSEVDLAEASLAVLVGPAGGFTENEFEQAEKAGAQPVTLGKRILRSETAAVYAASLITGCLDK